MSTKKVFGLLTIALNLMIVIGVSLVSATELITNAGMETGNTSGWAVNGAGSIAVSTAQKHSGTYSLYSTGRTGAWNGPQQNITSKVQSGKTYACSGWVRLDNTASASIILTIRKVDSGGTTYTNIATGTGSNSSWTQLSGSYILSVSGTLTDLSIYFEGPGSGINYYLDDVSVSDGVTSTPTPTRVNTPTPTQPPTSSYVRFRNVATSLYIDGMGSTSNGANSCQYSSSASNNQQWTLEAAGSNYKIKNRATGLYLDGMGRTSNGSICGQWSASSSPNQQWVRETAGVYYKFKNVTTGLYLDGMGSTGNGSNLCQYSRSSSTNQQWQIESSTATPTPTPTQTSGNKFHCFLLLGQSNMAGYALAQASDKVEDPRVLVLGYDNNPALGRVTDQWDVACPPLHPAWLDAIGPGDWFGKTMIQKVPVGDTIGLIPCAISGERIETFLKVGGTKYSWIINRAKLAQQAGGVIKGILFHQGESNNGDPSWPGKVKTLVTDLRNDLGLGNVPFLPGELLYGGACAGHNTLVNQLPSLITNCYVVSASGLIKDPADTYNLHFGHDSTVELGKRYAAKMIQALGW